MGPIPCGPSHHCSETLLELLLDLGIWGWDGRKVITMMTHGIAVWGIREREQGRGPQYEAESVKSRAGSTKKGLFMSEQQEIESNFSQIWTRNNKPHMEKWRVRKGFWHAQAR